MLKRSSFELPKQLIFIRHGEKPVPSEDTGNLSPIGYIHSGCWVQFFENHLPSTINMPEVIYAMKKGSKTTNSNRPVETIQPLADKLGLTINDNYLVDDYKGLLTSILSNDNINKTILVCWEHNNIPLIVSQLYHTIRQKCLQYPNIVGWGTNPSLASNDNDFSTVWTLNLVNGIVNFSINFGCTVCSDGTTCSFTA